MYIDIYLFLTKKEEKKTIIGISASITISQETKKKKKVEREEIGKYFL